MVVPSPTQIIRSEKYQAMELPVIDMSGDRREVSNQIVRACEEYGFFKVKNHGVPQDIIDNLERESLDFFAKPASEKQLAGPADPLGYGCRTIGFNGDMGEVEYLLFNTDPLFISQRSKTISNEPQKFRYVTLYLNNIVALSFVAVFSLVTYMHALMQSKYCFMIEFHQYSSFYILV